MCVRITVQREDFDVGLELAELRAGLPDIGAVASFIGTVSASNDGSTVSALELEHYPGMTEKSIGAIVDEAQRRWQLRAARVIHRIGRLEVGDQIVLVAVGSRHRGDAFAACEFIMDFLKTRAPFWKKESTADGERWVDARVGDEHAAARW
jgi:molybdopterin synthase catalytic subunit